MTQGPCQPKQWHQHWQDAASRAVRLRQAKPKRKHRRQQEVGVPEGTPASCARRSSAPACPSRGAAAAARGKSDRRAPTSSRQPLQSSKPSTAKAHGRPNSTIIAAAGCACGSKKAVCRCGKGVGLQAKLNSPQPTPSHGLARTSSSASRKDGHARRRPGAFRQPRRCAKRMLPTGRPQRQQVPAGSHHHRPAGWPARTSPSSGPASPTAPARQRLHSRCARHSAPRRTPRPARAPAAHAARAHAAPPTTRPRPGTTSEARQVIGLPQLPIARPARPDRAIQTPSATAGQNTCTSDTPTLSRPATSRPQHRPSTASARCAPPSHVQAPRPPPQPPVPRPAPRPGREATHGTRPTPRAPPPATRAPDQRLQLHATALTLRQQGRGPEQQHRAPAQQRQQLVEERGSGVRL